MATIQVEPGSKTVTGRLVDGTLMNASAGSRINGATHVVIKQGQSVRVTKAGFETTYTSSSGNRYISCGSGTVLAYRIS